MRLFLLFLIATPALALAEILTIDFVRVLNGNKDEALYYYEENWKQYRIEAKRRGYISSYRMLVRTSEEGGADILLITGYASEEQYEKREDNFAIVMDRGGEGGPRLLNEKKPGDFRQVIDGANYTDE